MNITDTTLQSVTARNPEFRPMPKRPDTIPFWRGINSFRREGGVPGVYYLGLARHRSIEAASDAPFLVLIVKIPDEDREAGDREWVIEALNGSDMHDKVTISHWAETSDIENVVYVHAGRDFGPFAVGKFPDEQTERGAS